MSDKFAEVESGGVLRVPLDLARAMGFVQGARVKVRQCGDQLILQRSAARIARVYIEPTTACNLRCQTCVRNVWNEAIGHMTPSTFARVLSSAKRLSELQTIVFGGFGEPLVHPDILDMIRETKQKTTARVELITNGMLLDEKLAASLIDLSLDEIWVSLDGMSPECYSDVRIEGDLQSVLRHLEQLRCLKSKRDSRTPRIGISFVAMKRNIGELPDILKLEDRVGARDFLVTHVYPHTADLWAQALYQHSVGDVQRSRSRIRLARPALTRDTAWILDAMIAGSFGPRLDGVDVLWPSDSCPFMLSGSTCIRWDGCVSPCLPLLHWHTSFPGTRSRTSRPYSIGSIGDHDLLTLWDSPEYVEFRRRLEEFDFPPCTSCSCKLAEDNQEDCFRNPAPTCGGCLWAQGFIRCP